MTKDELIDNMVSCYDNGDAMLEYVESYLLQFICSRCYKNFIDLSSNEDITNRNIQCISDDCNH